MLFSRFASYFVGFVSVGLLATAAALPGAENDEKKRQTDSVTTVLNTLETQVNTILPQISEFQGVLTLIVIISNLCRQVLLTLTHCRAPRRSLPS